MLFRCYSKLFLQDTIIVLRIFHNMIGQPDSILLNIIRINRTTAGLVKRALPFHNVANQCLTTEFGGSVRQQTPGSLNFGLQRNLRGPLYLVVKFLGGAKITFDVAGNPTVESQQVTS